MQNLAILIVKPVKVLDTFLSSSPAILFHTCAIAGSHFRTHSCTVKEKKRRTKKPTRSTNNTAQHRTRQPKQHNKSQHRDWGVESFDEISEVC
jgi:hypothetical protein